MSTQKPRFSARTIDFIKKASRQKNPLWLDRNREEYINALQAPLLELAKNLKAELSPLAPHYHFPQKGIGRIKYSSQRAAEHGGRIYKNWISYSASRPRTSRFEHNPNLFFLINLEDPKDTILVAGGLYMPSSRQVRAIREAISIDAKPFEKLFASKEFSRAFPGGFSDERISSRPPRGFDPQHPKMHWLKLQAFFVWKPYSRKEFYSPQFCKTVAKDFKQVLRLNECLERIISGQRVMPVAKKPTRAAPLEDRIANIDVFQRKMDF